MAAAQPAPLQSVDEVAAMYGRMTAVSVEFDRQLRLIAAAPQPLSQVTVEMLVHLLAVLQPAAEMRERLALLPPALLMDGIQVWLAREHQGAVAPARDRAAQAWAFGGAR